MRTLHRPLPAFLAVILLSWAGPAVGQDPTQGHPYSEEELAVLTAAQALLDIINARDAAAAHELLLPDGALVRVLVTDDGGDPQAIPHRSFMRTIGGPGPIMLERMWDAEVMVHGPIAIVWAPYEFFADDAFSHCGVNAFSLVRSGPEWKVAGVIYTVERECPESPFAGPEVSPR